MGLTSDPYCLFYPQGTTFFADIVWECPGILDLWRKVISTIATLTVQLPVEAAIGYNLLKDDSQLSLRGENT